MQIIVKNITKSIELAGCDKGKNKIKITIIDLKEIFLSFDVKSFIKVKSNIGIRLKKSCDW
jgi:tRNA threonylcarbamoyladenosine modification (KEOPS) complex Cgi121 subunit